jgi:hypothetical protein
VLWIQLALQTGNKPGQDMEVKKVKHNEKRTIIKKKAGT